MHFHIPAAWFQRVKAQFFYKHKTIPPKITFHLTHLFKENVNVHLNSHHSNDRNWFNVRLALHIHFHDEKEKLKWYENVLEPIRKATHLQPKVCFGATPTLYQFHSMAEGSSELPHLPVSLILARHLQKAPTH